MAKKSFTIIVVGKYKSSGEAFHKTINEFKEGSCDSEEKLLLQKEDIKAFEVPKYTDPYLYVEDLLYNTDMRDWPIEAPAGVVELKRAALKHAREDYGFGGERGIKGYIFFGWAEKECP